MSYCHYSLKDADPECLLRIVASLMDGVATQWASIGLFLGIPYKDIEIFKMEDSLENSVTRMVEAWLQRKHDSQAFGEPSWRRLVEAVASPSGGNNKSLASQIAAKHPLEGRLGVIMGRDGEGRGRGGEGSVR